MTWHYVTLAYKRIFENVPADYLKAEKNRGYNSSFLANCNFVLNSSPFFRALQQNRAQSRLLYLLTHLPKNVEMRQIRVRV